MPTKILGSFDNGNVRAELDWTVDGSDIVATAFRVINNTNFACYCSVTETASGRTYGQRFNANSTTERPLPTNLGQRIGGFIDARGRLDGIDFQMAWPYA